MRIKHQIQNRQIVTPTATALARVLNFILFLSTSLKRQFASTDTTLTYLVSDNGSYTIPYTDLAYYPSGCYVGILIGRGSQIQARLKVSGRLVNFWALTSLVTIPLRVNAL